MADNNHITVFKLIKKIRSIVSSYKNETLKSFNKVLRSFEHFSYNRFFEDTNFNPTLVFEWYAFLRLKGMTPNKAYYYIDKLGNLYSAACKSEKFFDKSTFKHIREAVKKLDSDPHSPLKVTLSNVEKILSLKENYKVNGNTIQNPSIEFSLDLLLFSLCNGGLSIEKMASFQKDSLDPDNYPSLEIAKKYISPKRKYIFPLDQSVLTKKQIKESVIRKLQPALSLLEVTNTLPSDEILTMLWICTAVNMGLSPSLAVAVAEYIPEDYRFLLLCEEKELQAPQKNEVVRKVAECIYTDNKKWYAMRLRPYVKYESLMQRLTSITKKDLLPEIFYPSETIAKKTGKKIVWKEKPVINDIVFFKAFPHKVYPLMSTLWDIAWCYREGKEKAYAVIPKKAMELFQDSIGQFTPEFEVAPAGEMPLKPGEKIIIIGGNYKDHFGIVIGSKPQSTEGEGIIYRIELLDSAGRWNIGVDARLLRPIPSQN